MKHLIDIINEGNIDRCERKYREFTGMCKSYCPDIDMKDVCVKKTSKNNWAVYGKCGDECKKLFIASYFVLDDDVIKNKGIEVCTESVNVEEAKEFEYTVRFMQYDPDVLAEYEDGDADDDDLHNSLQNSDMKDITLKAKSWREAESKINKELAKVTNKNTEVSACEVYGEDGELIDTIYV